MDRDVATGSCNCRVGSALAVVDEQAEPLARVFAALGNPVRLAILRVLIATEGCFCGDIVGMLPLAQSTVSHHLKVLKAAGLIRGDEQGTYVCYCANRERLATLGRWLQGLG